MKFNEDMEGAVGAGGSVLETVRGWRIIHIGGSKFNSKTPIINDTAPLRPGSLAWRGGSKVKADYLDFHDKDG